jgi:hypothetical protein
VPLGGNTAARSSDSTCSIASFSSNRSNCSNRSTAALPFKPLGWFKVPGSKFKVRLQRVQIVPIVNRFKKQKLPGNADRRRYLGVLTGVAQEKLISGL